MAGAMPPSVATGMRGFALPASPLTRPSRFSRASNCPSKRRNMFIDSHCHLNYKGLVEDQQNVLERARGAGVGLMLNIATRESEWDDVLRSEEHTSELQSLMRISYAVFCLKKKTYE